MGYDQWSGQVMQLCWCRMCTCERGLPSSFSLNMSRAMVPSPEHAKIVMPSGVHAMSDTACLQNVQSRIIVNQMPYTLPVTCIRSTCQLQPGKHIHEAEDDHALCMCTSQGTTLLQGRSSFIITQRQRRT